MKTVPTPCSSTKNPASARESRRILFSAVIFIVFSGDADFAGGKTRDGHTRLEIELPSKAWKRWVARTEKHTRYTSSKHLNLIPGTTAIETRFAFGSNAFTSPRTAWRRKDSTMSSYTRRSGPRKANISTIRGIHLRISKRILGVQNSQTHSIPLSRYRCTSQPSPN